MSAAPPLNYKSIGVWSSATGTTSTASRHTAVRAISISFCSVCLRLSKPRIPASPHELKSRESLIGPLDHLLGSINLLWVSNNLIKRLRINAEELHLSNSYLGVMLRISTNLSSSYLGVMLTTSTWPVHISVLGSVDIRNLCR
ncbi:hypothetical protein RRG08_017929 [Elysia crispata]|uniref:Uncharacterized protein n=1 Tax=Elysia crispata TaxID=231223 RepID=A0AAE1A9L4_9GAST|nr:hypothetical protein RRG08_017929 [Elysia crispata]